MRIAACTLAMLMLCSAMVPASAPQETKPQPAKDNSKFRPPNDVSDLLDVCGEAVNQLDTRSTQVASVNLMNLGGAWDGFRRSTNALPRCMSMRVLRI